MRSDADAERNAVGPQFRTTAAEICQRRIYWIRKFVLICVVELRSLSLFFSSGKFPAEHLSRYSVIFVKFSALVVFCDPTRSYTNCSITRCNRVMPNYASHEQNSVDAQNSSQHLSAKMISCLLHDKCRQGRKSQILVLEVKSSVLVLEPC